MIILLLLILSGPSSALDKYDILINDDYSGFDQSSPRVAIADSSHFAIVWTDKRYGRSDIFFQSLDSSGLFLGFNSIVNIDYNAIPHIKPAIDNGHLGASGDIFPTVWKDYRNGDYPHNPDIFFASADSSGAPDNFNVTITPPELTCKSPDVAVLSDGTIIVVWSDYRYGNWDIWGQRLSGNGTPIGNSFRINNDIGKNQQQAPRLASFQSGGFVVVWHDNRSGDDNIYAQRYDSSVARLGTNILIASDPADKRQAFPAVACDGDGRFFVAWVDWRNGTYPENPDIYMRRFDSAGVALENIKKVNSSSGTSAQREPSICADRMGNICVVWADSSTGQWDARAQVYNRTGGVEESNFRIHQQTIGKQLMPDVATDGYKFFFVWADSRDGDFDIYATIKQYNEPTLIPQPNQLEFTMLQGGGLPATQTSILTNAGYGELNWRAVSTANWLSVYPSSGITPDTLEVAINTDTLEYGTYYSNIRLIDADHNDSSEVIFVKLTVTAPILQVSPDTLYYKVLAELGNPENRKFRVNNIGQGSLTWTAQESSDWFGIDATSGIQGDYITVQPDISGLQYGDYYESLVVYSTEAVNSPETSWVHLELVGNIPNLDCRTDSLHFEGLAEDTFFAALEIINTGAGSLNWTAVTGDDWISLDKQNGSDYDTINVTIETSSLGTGSYLSFITVYDSASFNQQVTIPVYLYLSSGDTVQFFNSNIMTGGSGVMPVYVYLIKPVLGGYIPFDYSVVSATLDSIVPNVAALPTNVDFFTSNNLSGREGGEIGFYINPQSPGDTVIPSGNYHLANLFFSGGAIDAFNRVDTLSSDSSGVYFLSVSSNKKVPTIMAGDLIIGSPTDVIDETYPLLPHHPTMRQNYPNPFNSSTNIEIFLPRTRPVSLSIYNILGQRVQIVHEGELSAGQHILRWNGLLQNGLSAPSGIYFCRFSSEEYREIRKMVLLK